MRKIKINSKLYECPKCDFRWKHCYDLDYKDGNACCPTCGVVIDDGDDE